MGNGAWREYRRLVVGQLEDHHARLGDVEKAVVRIQVQAAAWGALAGIVGAVVGALALKGLTG